MIDTPQIVLMAAVLAMVAIMVIGSLIRDQKIKAKRAEFHQTEKKKNQSDSNSSVSSSESSSYGACGGGDGGGGC